MLIQIIKRTGLAVNPADITAVFIFKVNLDPILEVRMRDGENYRVHHEPHLPNGDDVYETYKRLLDGENKKLREACKDAIKFVAFAFDQGVEGAESAGIAMEQALEAAGRA